MQDKICKFLFVQERTGNMTISDNLSHKTTNKITPFFLQKRQQNSPKSIKIPNTLITLSHLPAHAITKLTDLLNKGSH